LVNSKQYHTVAY